MIPVDQAAKYYDTSDNAHDFNHVLRVTAMAEYIARAEGADLEIVRAAALLHDIARSDEDRTGRVDHAEMSARRAREILLGRGIDVAKADSVAHAIEAHRFRGSVQPKSLEAKILFDADKLDSIGAIGVARAFAVAGALNQPLWGEVPEGETAKRDQHNSSHSPYAEFIVKLRKIQGMIHTPTARRIAEGRHNYMSSFFERLGREMHGEL